VLLSLFVFNNNKTLVSGDIIISNVYIVNNIFGNQD